MQCGTVRYNIPLDTLGPIGRISLSSFRKWVVLTSSSEIRERTTPYANKKSRACSDGEAVFKDHETQHVYL